MDRGLYDDLALFVVVILFLDACAPLRGGVVLVSISSCVRVYSGFCGTINGKVFEIMSALFETWLLCDSHAHVCDADTSSGFSMTGIIRNHEQRWRSSTPVHS